MTVPIGLEAVVSGLIVEGVGLVLGRLRHWVVDFVEVLLVL